MSRSDETYLESFIEHIATLPHEVRRNLDLMKDLDKSCSYVSVVTNSNRMLGGGKGGEFAFSIPHVVLAELNSLVSLFVNRRQPISSGVRACICVCMCVFFTYSQNFV